MLLSLFVKVHTMQAKTLLFPPLPTPITETPLKSNATMVKLINFGRWFDIPLSSLDSRRCRQRRSGDFCVVDGPAGAFGQFCYHVVAVAEECDVEVNVIGRFAGDVDLRHLLVDIVRAVLDVLVSEFEVEQEKAEGELTSRRQERLSWMCR